MVLPRRLRSLVDVLLILGVPSCSWQKERGPPKVETRNGCRGCSEALAWGKCQQKQVLSLFFQNQMPKVVLGQLLLRHGLYCHLVVTQDTTGEAVRTAWLGLIQDNPSCKFFGPKAHTEI